MKKFIINEKGPFIRSVDDKVNSTRRMMYDLVISLIPLVIFGFIFFGLLPYIKGVDGFTFYNLISPLLNVIVGVLSSFVFETLYFFLFLNKYDFKKSINDALDSYAIIPGLFLALLFPANIPLYIIVFACFFANIIFKMLFGGLGHNIFNPALIGYAVAILAFSGKVNEAFSAQGVIVSKLLEAMFGSNFDIVASATPLASLKSIAGVNHQFFATSAELAESYGGVFRMFVGFKNGNLGEVSGLLCLVGMIYLIIRKVINWRVPVIYLLTTFVLCWIIGISNGVEGPVLGIWFPLYNLCSGGLFFGAIFMATEPVTTPRSPNGKVIFAVGLGVLSVLFRLIGMYPEGVGTAILFLCLFTPLIDKFASINRGPVITWKMVVSYSLIFGLFALIALYTVIKSKNISGESYTFTCNVIDFVKFNLRGILYVR